MQPNQNSDKNATYEETNSLSFNQDSKNAYQKLKIPKMNFFSMFPSYINKIGPEVSLREEKKEPKLFFKVKDNAAEADFSFNAATLKEHSYSEGKTTKSRTSDSEQDPVLAEHKANLHSDIEMDSRTHQDHSRFNSGHHSLVDERNVDEDEALIGHLTKAQRALKVKKYLEKKKKRQWEKKVNYQSRKKVADTRPRYKGRFVSAAEEETILKEYRRDQEKKLEKGRVFIVELFSRTGKLRKTIYPTEEAMRKFMTSSLI
jgi:hypothetical protein